MNILKLSLVTNYSISRFRNEFYILILIYFYKYTYYSCKNAFLIIIITVYICIIIIKDTNIHKHEVVVKNYFWLHINIVK